MSLPQGPQTPAFFQMLHWIVRPFDFMERCAQKYGDLFTVPLGNKFAPVIFVSSPEALQQMLMGTAFDAPGELNGLLEPLLGQQSVIGLSGRQHRRQRQLLMPPFHGDRMRTYGQLIGQVTEQEMSQWQLGQTFSVRESMQSISLKVILRAVFGLTEGPRYQQLQDLLKSMLDSMTSPLSVSTLYFPLLRLDVGPLSPWGNFLRQRQQVDQLIYAEITERREQSDSSRTDILSLLLSAKDEAGQPMSDVELHDELMTLLVAGHETTATALTWAIYWIHKFPTVRQKLLEELNHQDDPIDINSLARLPYLNALCSETLRIYPVGMLTFPRVVTSPVTLMGYALDPGTVLIGSIYLTHHRQDIYPNPKQFDPDRFLNRQFSPYEYLPFGGGNRRCLGMAFAQFEMKVVLAQLLSSFDLSLANGTDVKPVRRGLTSAPSTVNIIATRKRRQPMQKHQPIVV